MILLKLACDKCRREAKWSAMDHFTKTELRRTAQEEGWRFHRKADLCPECALKVLGVVGAMCAKNVP